MWENKKKYKIKKKEGLLWDGRLMLKKIKNLFHLLFKKTRLESGECNIYIVIHPWELLYQRTIRMS